MNNTVIVGKQEPTMRYGDLCKGTLFRLPNRVHDDNVYIKVGTKAVSLRTGQDFSNDQEKEVVPIKSGTIITITTG